MIITPLQFSQALGNISFPLAVAVSGGADSLALLLLANNYAKEHNGHVIALTVDHGLRPESPKEALQVQAWANQRGIEHIILNWKGEKPPSCLQEKAREARYKLLTNWCKDNGVHDLLLGHHAGDQEETFWMRLSAGSGLDGLSGIKKNVLKSGIALHRPLLSFSKGQLKETLASQNQDWIEDPSNKNERFLRGRLRLALEEEGLTSTRLLKVMTKLREDSDFIQQTVYTFVKNNAFLHQEGYITLPKDSFLELHASIAKRVIALLMGWFRGEAYPPRSSQLAIIIEKIKLAKPFTASGIYWVVKKKNISLFREVSMIRDPLSVENIKTLFLWDNRYWIDPKIRENVSRETFLAPVGAIVTPRALIASPQRGRGNLCAKKTDRLLRRGFAPPRSDDSAVNASNIPHHAFITLPALWEKGKVVAILPLCYTDQKCKRDLQKLINLKPLFQDSLTITM